MQSRHQHTRHESVRYLLPTHVILIENVAKLFLEIVFGRSVTNVHPRALFHIGYVKVKSREHNNQWHCRHDKSGIKFEDCG